MLSDLTSSAKYVEVKRAAEDREVWTHYRSCWGRKYGELQIRGMP